MSDPFGLILNQFRHAHGLGYLVLHPTVSQVAQDHAEDLARRHVLSHGSGGENMNTAADRLAHAGYSWRFAAENVAFGQKTPRDVFAAWEGSEGHRGNMLTTEAMDYGFGMAVNELGPYWVLVMSAPM